MAAGGDIIEVTFAHDTIGSGTFFPKGSEDSTFDLGGFRSTDDEEAVTGSGKMITTLNNKRWSFEVAIEWDMDDLEKLNELAASPVDADWTISVISGEIYAGKGRPVGDIKGNKNTSTIPFKISGGGKMEKQA